MAQTLPVLPKHGADEIPVSTERRMFQNRQDWLDGRINGIGASEASAILGLNPWMSSVELWKRKIGVSRPKELTGNAAVEQGHRLEPALRGLFQAQHPEYRVDYHEFDILYQAERDWLTATLDGELYDIDGRFGVLEIKTSLCSKRTDWEKWKNQVPPYYAVQVFHQMLATNADFVILYAWLVNLDGDAAVRAYHFERADHDEDLSYLLKREEEFWRYVQTGQMPPMVLSI